MPSRSIYRRRRTGVFAATAAAVCVALGLSAGAHATVLLTDNFNDDPNNDAATFNNNLSFTQGGSLATVTYSTIAPVGGWQAQHANGSRLLVATHLESGGNGSVSLNRNFAADANAADAPLSVSFNIMESSLAGGSDTSKWVQFNIGNGQHLDVVNPGVAYGMIFRVSTQWAGGPLGGNWAPNDLVTVVLSDTAGTGSAFDGNGSRADVYFNNVLMGTQFLAQQSNAYITFSGYNYGAGDFVIGTFDNLRIETIDPPAIPAPAALPAALALIGLAIARRRNRSRSIPCASHGGR